MNIHSGVHSGRRTWMLKRGEGFCESHWRHLCFLPCIYSSWLATALCQGALGGWIQCDNCVSACLFTRRTQCQPTVYLCMRCLSPSGKKRPTHPRTHTHAHPPRARRSLLVFLFFFSFLGYIIPLCLTWSPLTVSLLLVSFGSGSYSNPFLHASNRLILSLLSCCSTWQRIMPGTPFFLPSGSYIMCTFFFFTGTYKMKHFLFDSLPVSAKWPLISPP